MVCFQGLWSHVAFFDFVLLYILLLFLNITVFTLARNIRETIFFEGGWGGVIITCCLLTVFQRTEVDGI